MFDRCVVRRCCLTYGRASRGRRLWRGQLPCWRFVFSLKELSKICFCSTDLFGNLDHDSTFLEHHLISFL